MELIDGEWFNTHKLNQDLFNRAHQFKLPVKDDRKYVARLLFKDLY